MSGNRLFQYTALVGFIYLVRWKYMLEYLEIGRNCHIGTKHVISFLFYKNSLMTPLEGTNKYQTVSSTNQTLRAYPKTNILRETDWGTIRKLKKKPFSNNLAREVDFKFCWRDKASTTLITNDWVRVDRRTSFELEGHCTAPILP